MDPPVELRLLVMYVMPNIVLSVKDEKYSQSINDYLTKSWGLLWQCWCRQYEDTNCYSWQNKEYVLIQR